MNKQAYIPSDLELEGLLAITKQGGKKGTGRYALRNWTMLHLSYYAGMRAKEISSIDIGDIYDNGKVKLACNLTKAQSKGHPRSVRLKNDKLRKALDEYYKVQNLCNEVPNRPLFTNQQGARISPNGVVHLFDKMYESAELKYDSKGNTKCSTHSGRRYWATKLGNTPGITTKQMMRLGGWSQPNVAMTYVETNDEQLDELIDRAFK